jgi:DNA-directed RNA polymerase specialized sigma24 family protein
VEELVKYTRALVLLQIQTAQDVAERAGRPLKLALLLADAGLAQREIADMLGRTTTAVAKEISRGRSARRMDNPRPEVEPENDNG